MANISGNVLGAIVTGLVLLEYLGTVGTIRLLIGFGVVFVGLGSNILAELSPAKERQPHQEMNDPFPNPSNTRNTVNT